MKRKAINFAKKVYARLLRFNFVWKNRSRIRRIVRKARQRNLEEMKNSEAVVPLSWLPKKKKKEKKPKEKKAKKEKFLITGLAFLVAQFGKRLKMKKICTTCTSLLKGNRI